MKIREFLTAGIVTAMEGNFEKVDNFLLDGVLNGIGRQGGKQKASHVIQKILCHNTI